MNGSAGRQGANPPRAARASTSPGPQGHERADLTAQVAALQRRWDLLIPNLATREQLAEGLSGVRTDLHASCGAIRQDMHKGQLSMIKWMAAFSIAVGSASVGAVKLMMDPGARSTPYAVAAGHVPTKEASVLTAADEDLAALK